jgi:hypothetical protein
LKLQAKGSPILDRLIQRVGHAATGPTDPTGQWWLNFEGLGDAGLIHRPTECHRKGCLSSIDRMIGPTEIADAGNRMAAAQEQ